MNYKSNYTWLCYCFALQEENKTAAETKMSLFCYLVWRQQQILFVLESKEYFIKLELDNTILLMITDSWWDISKQQILTDDIIFK